MFHKNRPDTRAARPALTVLLLLAAALPIWAQSQPANSSLVSSKHFVKPKIRMATDEEILRLGIAQGNIVIPYTSLDLPDDTSRTLHTHVLIFRPSAAESNPLLDDNAVLPAARTGSGPSGSFLPTDLYTAYGVPSNGGAGIIAIIDAYDYPNALSDFNTFCGIAGLAKETSTNVLSSSNKVLQVVYASGRKSPVDPSPSTDNANLESALDIQWAHAMAPKAKIILVLGRSLSYYDLLITAVNRANNIPGVKQVSMSFGSSEFSSEYFYDRYFQKSGIVYFASTGDTGGSISYPSCSPYVVGVGGTSLTTGTSQVYVSESGWSGSGGGASSVYSVQSFQSGVKANGVALTRRSVPDLSFLADPTTGALAVLNGSGYIVGGTSLACPCIAGIVNTKQSNYTSSQAQLTALYTNYKSANYSTLFHDITSGTAGSFSTYTGWDFVTGVGTPKTDGGL